MDDDPTVHHGELVVPFDSAVDEDEEDRQPLTLTQVHLERRARRKRNFLKLYAEIGLVRNACEMAGISRRVIYVWMADDAAFAAAFQRAGEIATDRLEQEARRRALHGITEPVYYQGNVVGHIQKYSDLLLLAMLNAYRPEKFKNRQEHTGKDGGPIAVVHVSYDHNMKPDDM